MIKKNNKGFTLIEIIAVVTLIGILSILVVPKIFSLVNDSRKSIYVEDAIRLISKAQFTMNSQSVKIEKPDKGEVIIFSMKYLSPADFQSPPNGGVYLPESSFVVVKNVNGKYIYSAMLVEKTKDSEYIGVELSTENALNAADATKHVKNFKIEELAYIDMTTGLDGGTYLDSDYIDDNIKGEDTTEEDTWKNGDIVGYYNNELGDEDVILDTVTPRISAKFSTSGSLQTVLTIGAIDNDNNISDLKVFIKISHSGNDSFPTITDTGGMSYGSEDYFTYPIDFSTVSPPFSYNTTSPETAYVYIVVVDPQKNYARKKLSYDIHSNELPKIEKFTVTKDSQDKYNMPRAKVTLRVSDDMDATEDLMVCFSQNEILNLSFGYPNCGKYRGDNSNR